MTVTAVQRARSQFPEASPAPAPERGRPPERSASASVRSLVAGASKAETRKLSEAATSSRLNAFMHASAGPYTVRGAEVRVTPQFRMEGGFNRGGAARIEKAVGPEAWKKIALDAKWSTTGKGSLEAIRVTTQALIDSPAFRKYAHLDAETAIRKMQWEFGIGLDCSGYVHQAFLFTRGSGEASAPSARYGLGKVEDSGLQRLPGPFFQRIEPAQARAGDAIVLVQGSDGTGHKVIVHGRHAIPAGTELHARAVEALGGGKDAKVHVITVDSSWGAGRGEDPHGGGVKRVEWIYDETSRKWGTLHRLPSGGVYVHPSSKSGPYDHVTHGVFRPKGES